MKLTERGAARLSAYDLFYRHPLCRYAKGDIRRVLIAGTDEAAEEAFKVCFPAGQYPEGALEITVLGETAGKAEKFLNGLQEQYPGTKDFITYPGGESKYDYARAKCAGSVGELSPDYVIVTDEKLGGDAVKTLRESGLDPFVAVYAEKSEIENAAAYRHGDTKDFTTLLNAGADVDFMYTSQYEPETNRKAHLETFMSKGVEKEFCEPSDPPYPPYPPFFGKNYAVDSSVAQAVHSPVKLYYCSDSTDIAKQIGALIGIINERGTKFNKLAALEHRRWNAFTVFRGYRRPTEDEIENELFRRGNKQRCNDPENLWHVALCECSDGGRKLYPHSRYWNWDYTKLPDSMCELDKASVRCHNVLNKIDVENGTKEKLKEIIRKLDGFSTKNARLTDAKRGYMSALSRLRRGDESSYKMTERFGKDLRSVCGDIRNASANDKDALNKIAELETILNEADAALTITKEKANRADYFGYDFSFIEMMPFTLRLGGGVTVVTRLGNDPVKEVMAPWLIRADRAVYLTAQRDERKENAIEKFFENRGSNTAVEFVSVTKEPNSVGKAVKALINGAAEGERILYYYGGGIPIGILNSLKRCCPSLAFIAVTPEEGVQFMEAEPFMPARINGSLDVNDFQDLMSGSFEERGSTFLSYDKCSRFEEFFWNSNLLQIIPEKGKTFTNWKFITDPLINAARDENDPCARRMKNAKADGFEEFIQLMKDTSVISDVKNDGKETCFTVTDENSYDYFAAQSGKYFESLVYFKFLHSCLFKDVRCGVTLQKYNRSGKCSMRELDVAATVGTELFLCSCKTTAQIKPGFVDEILARKIMYGASHAILAVSQDLSSPDNPYHSVVESAAASGVDVLDQHVLKDEKLLKKALEQIIANVYEGPENFR